MKVFIILSLAAAAVAQLAAPPQYKPIPYSFNYVAENEDGGSSSHQESGDGAGRVSGSYSVNDLEGHARVVEYVADEGGFRANIRSNEPGIISAAPADVVIESSGGSGAVAPAAARVISAPVAAPVVRSTQPASQPASRSGIRYVLVPESDPRAAGGIPI
ncbi:cuticle protein 10.9-like [Stegodyphus dumicola]|uniref:cuticle protein 10.9-like n=1 Tax=Stegodyphus dumicola TaxID=202533 RepID=UPI0015B0E9BB|nr:cuticle protein 10.9-like [Stegodyphus dumicola]